MKKTVRILIGVGCCVLLIISWLLAVNAKSQTEKQLLLISQAAAMIEDGIYIKAMPLLEEAVGYGAAHTEAAETMLKHVYLELLGNRGISRKYISLLESQMSRQDAKSEIFMEAANYSFSISKNNEALAILRTGIEKTLCVELVTLYENTRYAYETSRTAFDAVTAIYDGTVQVQLNGKWGIAGADGTEIIPYEYDKISTFSNGRAIVTSNGAIYAVDRNNNRTALADSGVTGFGNLAENRVPLLIDGSWYRATSEFEVGINMFEDLGMYSNGYAAAKVNGKWGVIDKSTGWLIPAEYDEIIQDELGRCYAQGAVFVRDGDLVYMFADGIRVEGAYQNAYPFSNEGFAAVKRDDKWGFIDTAGNVVIEFIYDDALSFGQHLAAVKIGELWGYISIYGHIVIEPVFYDAKSFSDGSAPVLTERGWQFITLLEYKKGATL